MAINEIDACNKSDSLKSVAIRAVKVKISNDSTYIAHLEKQAYSKEKPKKWDVIRVRLNSGLVGAVLAIVAVLVI